MSTTERRGVSPALVALPVALLALGTACARAPQTTLAPMSDVARTQYDLGRMLVVGGAAVFVLVELFLVWTIVRYRARPGVAAPAGQEGGTARFEVAWTLIPVVLLALVAVPTVQANYATQRRAPRGALPVQVIGHQWWWEFRYPTLGIVTANELHLPAGQPASLTLTSADVMHGFWLPSLGGKRDVLPGLVTHLQWTPDRVGTTAPGECTQFCGTQHAHMGMRVMVQPRAAFDAWVRTQQQPHATPAPERLAGDGRAAVGLAAEGARIFAGNACIACHTIAPVSAGQNGPNLTHVGGRTTIAAGVLANTPENLARWIRDPQGVKPGAGMPHVPLDSAEVRAVVAYLETLR